MDRRVIYKHENQWYYKGRKLTPLGEQIRFFDHPWLICYMQDLHREMIKSNAQFSGIWFKARKHIEESDDGGSYLLSHIKRTWIEVIFYKSKDTLSNTYYA